MKSSGKQPELRGPSRTPASQALIRRRAQTRPHAQDRSSARTRVQARPRAQIPAQSLPPKRPHPVLVVGGGVAGQKAALDLVQAGLDVLLLEKETSLGGKPGTAPAAPGPLSPRISWIMRGRRGCPSGRGAGRRAWQAAQVSTAYRYYVSRATWMKPAA
jgi:hypothetical protein